VLVGLSDAASADAVAVKDVPAKVREAGDKAAPGVEWIIARKVVETARRSSGSNCQKGRQRTARAGRPSRAGLQKQAR
jgi:hypothetical protein